MNTIYHFFTKLFLQQAPDRSVSAVQNIFDYSSKERIKLLRAAGREAQREQKAVLDLYQKRFGQA